MAENSLAVLCSADFEGKQEPGIMGVSAMEKSQKGVDAGQRKFWDESKGYDRVEMV
jgi:hypothetical protein